MSYKEVEAGIQVFWNCSVLSSGEKLRPLVLEKTMTAHPCAMEGNGVAFFVYFRQVDGVWKLPLRNKGKIFVLKFCFVAFLIRKQISVKETWRWSISRNLFNYCLTLQSQCYPWKLFIFGLIWGKKKGISLVFWFEVNILLLKENARRSMQSEISLFAEHCREKCSLRQRLLVCGAWHREQLQAVKW